MYSAEIEKRPTVGQMRELQKIGVVLGKRQGSLRESKAAANARLFLPKQVDGYDFAATDDSEYYWSHRFTGRVAKTGINQWSMRIVEIFWVKDEETGHNDGNRTAYRFEWTNRSVLTALKQVHVRKAQIPDSSRVYHAQMVEQPQLVLCGGGDALVIEERPAITAVIDDPDVMPSSEPFGPVMTNALEQTKFISQADCDKLAGDMQAFSQISRTLHWRSAGIRPWEPNVAL
jgi:hypothetical protein